MPIEWYALRVKPHKEASVCQLLQAREVELFYPMLRIRPKSGRGASEKPYFPGYIFVRVNLTHLGINAFSWIPGTHGLVVFGGEPAVVPAHLVQELKQRLVRLTAEAFFRPPSLKSGDKVRILSGPFQGYEAIFDAHLPGKERVQVLLAFLSSQPQRLKLEAAQLERVRQDQEV